MLGERAKKSVEGKAELREVFLTMAVYASTTANISILAVLMSG